MTATFSFLIPLFNEEDNLPELYRRVSAVMDTLDGVCELILVDDGSTDNSLPIIKALEKNDGRIRYVSFARNFGHQLALTAGLSAARGACVIILDADLQDPPEIVPQMIELWRRGSHVVYARRSRREREGLLKRLFAYGFYRMLRTLAEIEIPADTGDFCLLDRRVVDVLNGMPERHRYLRGLRSWTGFRQAAVSFERPPRFAGTVKYSFQKSLRLAISGLVAFSAAPLRLSTYVGLVSAGIAGTMALLVVYWRLRVPNSPVVGFAWIATVIFLLAAVQLISIGVLGEYVARIHDEVKARPLFVVKETSARTVVGFGVGVPLGGEQPIGAGPPQESPESSRWRDFPGVDAPSPVRQQEAVRSDTSAA